MRGRLQAFQDVVLRRETMAYVAAGPASHQPYSRLNSLLDEMGPDLRREPPPALRQLADITDFTWGGKGIGTSGEK